MNQKPQIFRGRVSVRSRRRESLQMVLLVMPVFLLFSIFATGMNGKLTWTAFATMASFLGVVFAGMAAAMLLTPYVRYIRIDEQSIVVTRAPFRRIVRMRWSDVQQMVWLRHWIELRSSNSKIQTFRIQFAPETWTAIREVMYGRLQNAFDLNVAESQQRRTSPPMSRIVIRWAQVVMVAVVVAALMITPAVMWTFTGREIFRTIGAIVFLGFWPALFVYLLATGRLKQKVLKRIDV